jgi:secondary thiamine-phosphate synthase enzyme
MEGEISEVSGIKHFARALSIAIGGRGTWDISGDVQRVVQESGVRSGLCHVFIHHTSASLIVCENADPTVQSDLERFMARLVPDGEPLFAHTAEGPDDMPAHVRSVLTQTSLSLPIANGRCDLGTWQGVYLWEHRHRAQRRKITVSVLGS